MKVCKLLTPGPLTTSETVKAQMLIDRCTWDEEYKSMTQKIRHQLLKVAKASEELYTVILMQGSGTFGVEAVLGTELKSEDKCLIVINGAYGKRMAKIAECLGINYDVYKVNYKTIPDVENIRNIIQRDKQISHIAMVHCETTTGILNPIEEIAGLCKEYRKTFILDAMSSFGGVPIDVENLGIDYLVSSANKCIQGVPGFSFVIAKKEKLSACKGNSKSLSLDLYDQWKNMEKDGKWRFTSPTHAVAAFSMALDELEREGGVQKRYERYKKNNKLLRKRLEDIGINAYICKEFQSPIITTFLFPYKGFDFEKFYNYIKERGFILYPGKLTYEDTFRIGNIGEVYEKDIKKLCDIIQEYIRRSR
ncbi:2-aminoethylphosphonate-pyruvate transaminase [Caminicella sporogenes DSM 14501]|uniref:2-aminoethylphosphonate--pyruvate transaminase n=1 Tax=Caminicella sporogenes DSM 14501 TaxID=1121266 RepID=A0A1M6S210_9FIRM|nr:2-aminoethylphosphonate--pyruvate transaminase [Caminicella sporogenes]RKD27172.1 2-aminoethylphosphonate--pyruvate transaminase [Caminicella sporogenes]SHK38874.1 2-aminoethylphosphonate-pyruvate transaminase [Caminicella sporogenes DSM 14501]